MKRSKPRLVIQRETLRVLDRLRLDDVAGGDDAVRDTRPAVCPGVAVAKPPGA